MASFAAPRKIVVIGGGIQGTSVAFQLAKKCGQTASQGEEPTTIIILEAKEPASAASGKGGGFMARSWGDGSPTQRLHELAFDMYEELSKEIGSETYRKLPVLSVSPGYLGGGGVARARGDRRLGPILPNWLDGDVGRISAMGMGDDTAQVTPKEFVTKMLEAADDKISVILGTCTGVETEVGAETDTRKVTAVKYVPRGETKETQLESDAVVVSAGPWTCQAEDWFPNGLELPMQGIKSTSIVWKKPTEGEVDATALFCGEDDRFGTHLEVYPRPDGTIYLCGIGGSDYISKEKLKEGAFREECDPKEARVEAARRSFQEMSNLYKNVGELDRTQACMRPCPPDAMPYMGKVPGYEGAFINGGHNCWGIAWAPACGLAMSELVMEGDSKSVDLRPFDPARFSATVTGGRGRKRRGTSVGEQW